MARSCINKYNDYRTYDRRSVSRESSTSRERSQSTSPMRNRRSGTPYYNGKSTERDSDRENATQVRSPIEKRTTIKKTTAVINETGKKNGNPLFLAGKIENKHTNLFIDCGSGISLISDVVYRQISNKKLQQSSAKLQTANQQPLQVLGKTRLNISVHGTSRKEGKFETCFEFHVTEGLSHEVLLGMDFLETYNAIIDTKNKKITIEDNYAAVTVHKLISINQNSFNVDVVADSDIRIPARSEILLTGKLTGEVDDGRVGLFHPNKDEQVAIAAHTVAVVCDGTVTVRLLNPSNEEKIITCGAILGALEDLEEDDIYENNELNKQQQTETKVRENSDIIDNIDIGDNETSHTEKERLKRLLTKYANVFSKHATDLGFTDVIEHGIELTGERPKRQGPRPLTPPMRQELKKHLQELLDADVIRPSTSEYSSPVVLVRKRDGSTRFCIDFRSINKVSRSTSYGLPKLTDAMNSLGGVTIFSTLDMRSGYWQVGMKEDDIPKTAFSTMYGQYEWTRMPQGLSGSAATFQRLVDCVMAGLQYETLIVYLDDIIVFGKNYIEHLQKLEEVLKRLQNANLKLSPNKCHFMKTRVTYLDHIVSQGEIKPDPAKVKAIAEYPQPRDIKELRSFIGLASYYRRFLRNFSQIASPLNRLLEKKVAYVWDKECEKAFTKVKYSLSNDIVVCFPDYTRPFVVAADASNVAIGAVISNVMDDGTERPIAYMSKTLNKTQRKWSTIEREAYAVIVALNEFNCYLWGRHFTLVTDHRPLTWLKTMPNPSPKFARWQMSLQQYDFDIVYKAGKTNRNADALSRICVNNTNIIYFDSEINEDMIREEQENDPVLQELRKAMDGENITVKRNSKLATLLNKIDELYINENGIIYRLSNEDTTQIVLPSSLHESVFELLHEQPCAGHLGAEKTEKRFADHFYYPNIKPKIIECVRKCRECAIHKPSRENTIAPMKHIKASRPLQILQLDFVGPVTKSHDNKKYILTMIDHFTKYAQAFATEKCDTNTVINCLEQYFCIFGVPESIQTDNGTAFKSHNFNSFCDTFGIRAVHSTAYHAQSQGQVEKFNGTLTKMLSNYTGEKQTDWTDYINLCVFAYNTAVKKSIKISPHEAMFGTKARSTFSALTNKQDDGKSPTEYTTKVRQRLQDIYKQIKTNQDFADEMSKEYYDKTKASKVTFNVGSHVWLDDPVHKVGLTDKFRPKLSGPWIVKEKIKSCNYKIESEDAKLKPQIVHQNRLRTCYAPKLQMETVNENIQNKPKAKPIATRNEQTTDSDTDSDDDTIFWYTDQPLINVTAHNYTDENEMADQDKVKKTTKGNNNERKAQTKEVEKKEQRNIIEQQERNKSSETSSYELNDKANTTTDDIFFDTQNNDQVIQEQNAERNEENEEIREWIAILGEGESNNTSIDDTFQDPDYHPPEIINRQATPTTKEPMEDEAPARRYPLRTRKEPQRYTVNAITVTTRRPYAVTSKNKKQVNFVNNDETMNTCYINLSGTMTKTNNKLSIANYYLMLLCMTMITVSKCEHVIKTDIDLGSIIGSVNWCSTHGTHDATYILLEDRDDCTIRDPRVGHVDKVMITPYFPRHFSDSFDIFTCSFELSVVETFYSFFEGQSVNGRWTSNEPISEIECRKYLDKIKRLDNSFIQLRTKVWSDKSSQVQASYTWCCRSVNTTQTRIIVKKFNAVVNFVTNKLMSANINLESCTNIEKQYCVTETATVIWNDILQEECKYTRGTDVIGEKSGSNYCVRAR